jgi:hypothetical protein
VDISRAGEEAGQMATLWLYQMADHLSINAGLDGDFQRSVQTTLLRYASWPGSPKVAWTNNLASAQVTPQDCVVYFVHGFHSGAANYLLSHTGGRLSAADLQLVDSTNYTELGLCLTVPHQPTVSEVHIDKCLNAVRQARRFHTDFDATEMIDYPLLLAAVAWHEAMHNKVEPHMRRGWDQHRSGGDWAGTFTCGPSGGFLRPRAPDRTSIGLMSTHFARPTRQYIYGMS